jgi:hypothetical protein
MTETQLFLPFQPPSRIRHGRPVEARAENEALYAAVLTLRRAGRQVYRAGADHKVDGRLLSTHDLLALAASEKDGER